MNDEQDTTNGAPNGEQAAPTRLDKYEPGALVFLRADEGSIGEGVVIDDQDDIILAKFADCLEAENAALGTWQGAVDHLAEFPDDDSLARLEELGDEPQPSAALVFNRHQVALTLEGLRETEPPIEGAELQELLNLAANTVANEAARVLAVVEKYARDRWGTNSNREGAFKAAAIGAMIGAGQGQLGAASPTTLGIVDSVARTVAIALLVQSGHAVAAAELERAQNEGRIEAMLAGRAIREEAN